MNGPTEPGFYIVHYKKLITSVPRTVQAWPNTYHVGTTGYVYAIGLAWVTGSAPFFQVKLVDYQSLNAVTPNLTDPTAIKWIKIVEVPEVETVTNG